jgi:hypothetical protein
MSYIGSPEPQYGARKYTGSVATGYDAKRVESPKWAAEQAIIEGIIDSFPKGSFVLDVPMSAMITSGSASISAMTCSPKPARR